MTEDFASFKNTPISVLRGFDSPLTFISLPFSTDTSLDELIYAGCQNGNVVIWNLTYKSMQSTIKAFDVAVLCIHQTSEYLMAQGKSGVYKLWRKSDLKLLVSYDFASYGFCKFLLLSEEKSEALAILQDESGNSILHSITSNGFYERESAFANPFQKSVTAMSILYCLRLNCILISYENGFIYVVNRGQEKKSCYLQLFKLSPILFTEIHERTESGIAISPEEGLAKFTFSLNKLECENVYSMENCHEISMLAISQKNVFSLGYTNGNVDIHGFDSFSFLTRLNFHTKLISCIKFFSNTDAMIVSSNDGLTSIWRTIF